MHRLLGANINQPTYTDYSKSRVRRELSRAGLLLVEVTRMATTGEESIDRQFWPVAPRQPRPAYPHARPLISRSFASRKTMSAAAVRAKVALSRGSLYSVARACSNESLAGPTAR